MRKYLLSAAAVIAMAGVAHADDSVTVNGITLYGTIDLGIAYQTHGAQLSDYAPSGLQYLAYAGKNLRNGLVSMAPNGLSQSKLGIKGVEELVDGWSALFKLETGFLPTSGQLDNGPGSVILQNGRTPAQTTATYGDSSRSGQAFQGGAYAGVTNAKYGTLTFGRQNSLLMDNVLKYDPQGGSYAFSMLGFTGTFGGAGDTQDGRLDNNLVYLYRYGPVRASAEYAFGGQNDASRDQYSFGLGADVERLSIDANYVRRKDGVTFASPLSAGQLAGTPVAGTQQLPASQLVGTGYGTVSDNTAYAIMASYSLGAPKVFAGYEHIEWQNPSIGMTPGQTAIGVTIGAVNNNAYTHHRDWNVAWTGLKYSVTPAFDVTGAYYYYSQNNYRGESCVHNSDAGSCSGEFNMVSLVADYRLTKRFDVYGGVSWSQAVGGPGAGTAFDHNNTITPMVGTRFSF